MSVTSSALDRMSESREFGEFGGVNPSTEGSTTFTVLDPELMDGLFQGAVGPQNGRHFEVSMVKILGLFWLSPYCPPGGG